MLPWYVGILTKAWVAKPSNPKRIYSEGSPTMVNGAYSQVSTIRIASNLSAALGQRASNNTSYFHVDFIIIISKRCLQTITGAPYQTQPPP